jgi:hypothetical protein
MGTFSKFVAGRNGPEHAVVHWSRTDPRNLAGCSVLWEMYERASATAKSSAAVSDVAASAEPCASDSSASAEPGASDSAASAEPRASDSAEPSAAESTTLLDVARALDNTGLWLNSDVQVALLELSFALEPNGCFPRLYFECADWEEVTYLEFFPGHRRANCGVLRLRRPESVEDEARDAVLWAQKEAEWDAVLATAPEMSGYVVRARGAGPTAEERACAEHACGGKEALDHLLLLAALRRMVP